MTRPLAATALTNEDFANGEIFTTRGAPDARYAWDVGVGIGRYLAALKEGRIIGTRCPRCRRTVLPPRAFCENCMSAHVEWVDLKETGRVNTFSICRVSWDAKPLDPPQIPAVIEIDGATAPCGILHLLGDVKPRDVKIGMAVRAVWKPAAERVGAIGDIRWFRPA